jgi:RHS repeat-associated protein
VDNRAPLSGAQVNFSGSASTSSGAGCYITSYLWTFGDGATSTSRDPSHTFYSPSGGATSYPVSLQVVDSCGKSDTKYLSIYVTGQALGNNPQQPFSKDPVNLATGNYTYNHVDLRLPGRGLPFEFKRFYNSKDTTSTGLPVGYGWTHSYNISVSVNSSNSAAMVAFGDGHQETYSTNGMGGYTADVGVFNTLTSAAGLFTLTTKEQQKYNFDAQGRLSSIADKNNNTVTLLYNGVNLAAITDTVGRSIVFSNNANNCLTQITDPIGRTVWFGYDANANLIGVTDLRGGVTQFAYDAYHQLTNAVDPRGSAFVSMVYDSQRRVVSSQKDAFMNATAFDYDFVNGVTTVTDPYGNKSYNYYDERLRLTRTVDNLGNVENFEYDGDNNRTKVIDKNGGVTIYAYDSIGNVTSKVDPYGGTTLIAYDTKNNPTNRTDALGGITLFAYDANGNPTNTVNALGKTSSVRYDGFGEPVLLTDAKGSTTTNAYDTLANLIMVQNALGGSNVFTFDSVGRKLTGVDALGRTNRFAYDNADNLIAFVDALRDTNSFSYDANNNRLTVTDFLGNTWTSIYDQKDRLIIARDPLGGSITNDYDKLDRKVRVWDAMGGLTQYAYDSVGNLVAVTNAAGNVTTYAYDGNGNRTNATTSLGNTTTYAYDSLNRLVSITDPLGFSTVSVFDPLGRRIQSIDQLQRTNQFTYDALDRFIRFTDAAGGGVTNSYDNVGNRTSGTDPNGNTATSAFDALNRLVTTVEPGGGVSRFTYDAVGNVLTKTDPNNHTIAYQYDGNNRRTRITYPAGAPVTFSYDANGNRTSMTDSLGTTTYLYDVLNRLTNVSDCFGKSVNYGYDKNGNRTSLTYPGNKTVSYAYDPMNRMTRVTDWLGHATTYAYDPDGNLTNSVNPNGTATSYTYESNRLASLTNAGPGSAIICGYTYTLDAVGNHIHVDQVEPLPFTAVPGPLSYSYDSDNRMVVNGGQAQGFDANGNMTSSGTNLLFYDYENRLTQALVAGLTSTYQYDGLGDRMTASRGAVTTRYVLDRASPLSQVLVETDSAGAAAAYYVYGLGLISRIDPGGNVQYYHFDSRGSTIAISGSGGQVTDAYAYDPFGIPASESGGADNRFRYLGKHGVVDEENGLNYIRARYYSSGAGRFITKDPTVGKDGDSQSMNRYIYALNNPVRLIDTSGLSAQETSAQNLQLATSDGIFSHNLFISPETQGLDMRVANTTPMSQSSDEGNGNNPGLIDYITQLIPGAGSCAGPGYDCSNPNNPRRLDPSPGNQAALRHDVALHNSGDSWSDITNPSVYQAHLNLANEHPSPVFKVLFGTLGIEGLSLNTYMGVINAAGNLLYQTTGF